MKNKKIILTIIIVIFVIGGILAGYYLLGDNEITDAQKFSNEYGEIGEDNVIVYRSIDEIKKILENGTGIVYLGFPECQWCDKYVVYLNEVAKEEDVERIYYFNVLKDRQDDTDDYLELVEMLEEYLQYDEEGNKRIYVPAVIAVKNGEIVGFDDETAWDTKGYETPEEYWQNEDLEGLKSRLRAMFSEAKTNICTSNCNE